MATQNETARGSRTGGRGAQKPARQTRPSLPPPRRATVRRGGERPRATTPDRRGRCAGTEVITNPAEEGRAAPLTAMRGDAYYDLGSEAAVTSGRKGAA